MQRHVRNQNNKAQKRHGRALGTTADWPRSSMRFDTRGVTTKMDNAMSEEDSLP